MTRLRKMMLDELERRNYTQTTRRDYTQTTRRAYLLAVEQFAKHYQRSPDQLGLDHIRDYQAHLFRVRKLQPTTVTVRLAGLRFLFVAVLKRPWSVDDTPDPKRPQKLPTVLSQPEVARLIDSAPMPLHRIVLMMLYATGLRRTELTRVKITDIDSDRMVIHVIGGKGRKDRDVMLSPKLLAALRQYWRGLKHKPQTWLFPSGRSHGRTEIPMSDKVVWYACEQAAKRARIDKPIHPHTLRNASAYCTTFQSPFILKTIDLGQARCAEVYGRRAGPPSRATALPLRTSPFSRLSTERTSQLASLEECARESGA